ncbi:MAG: purine-binding chemotaxis protein CheW [Deltaproteobacteria bacterium]|nr:purine-binding chemotaxis protein CheW [Deltaproteobacteria bacterium]
MAASDEQLKSELILDELKKRQRTKDVVDVEEERVKIVIFTSGGNRYAFYGNGISEILPACEISWVPGLPEYLPGLINIRGDIESVIDIRYFLGGERADPKKSHIAMAAWEGFHSGVMIDSIEDVVDIPLSAIEPPLSTLGGAARDLVAGEIRYGGETVTLLDIGKLAAKITL